MPPWAFLMCGLAFYNKANVSRNHWLLNADRRSTPRKVTEHSDNWCAPSRRCGARCKATPDENVEKLWRGKGRCPRGGTWPEMPMIASTTWPTRRFWWSHVITINMNMMHIIVSLKQDNIHFVFDWICNSTQQKLWVGRSTLAHVQAVAMLN